MMRLGAFDPRVRGLSRLGKLRMFDPRIRSLSGFGGPRLGCTECSHTIGLGRLSRMSRLGDDLTPAEQVFLDTGVFIPQPGDISTTDATYSNTLTPPAGPNYGISPQQQVAQAAYGTTNLLQLSPAQSAAIMAAVGPSASAVPALTAAQIAAIRSAAPPSVVPSGTLLGIPTSYFLYAGVGLAALMLLGSGKRR
jgi:hypothetical protein